MLYFVTNNILNGNRIQYDIFEYAIRMFLIIFQGNCQ